MGSSPRAIGSFIKGEKPDLTLIRLFTNLGFGATPGNSLKLSEISLGIALPAVLRDHMVVRIKPRSFESKTTDKQ